MHHKWSVSLAKKTRLSGPRRCGVAFCNPCDLNPLCCTDFWTSKYCWVALRSLRVDWCLANAGIMDRCWIPKEADTFQSKTARKRSRESQLARVKIQTACISELFAHDFVLVGSNSTPLRRLQVRRADAELRSLSPVRAPGRVSQAFHMSVSAALSSITCGAKSWLTDATPH